MIVYIISIPFILLLSFKTKYKDSLPSRFFLKNNPKLKANGIWFHSCSLGEAKAIKPIIERLNQDDIRLTTTTNTGFGEISKYSSQSRYLPFEILLPFWIESQKVLVVMEAEYWYMLFLLSKLKGAKIVVINARMSDNSYKSYLKFRWFYRKIFALVDKIYAQSNIDKERLESLGATNIDVIGNIKLYKLPQPSKKLQKLNSLIVTGASTHDKEDILILEAFKALKNREKSSKLILVPRHNFDKIVELASNFASNNNLSFSQYSQDKSLSSDITVVDLLGELINLYTISDIVIMGGSFEPIGGHNVAEASQFGCKIISGKEYFNQKDIYRSISGIKIIDNSELSQTLLNYHQLEPTKILRETDIEAILGSIKV
ncbi:Lipid IVA 3-deoxy-D-manno-octulosonic acid transferase [often with also] [hydrothermal vent metagenome]|uniref:Lipid IVA 3-deoxy-D-manno-octulosonic acid transferase [often with also] n=1 Tax=hydrothermal vent metagenome TaxID=652676 RepID=A0A1W1ELF4_9ZZZZ